VEAGPGEGGCENELVGEVRVMSHVAYDMGEGENQSDKTALHAGWMGERWNAGKGGSAAQEE
jgi:hypothetical protein